MYSTGYSVQTPGSGRNPRAKKRKNFDNTVEEIHCSVCDIWVQGVPQYQSHVEGGKHQKRAKEKSVDEVVNRMPFMKFDNEKGTYLCKMCDVTLNSSLVAMMHVDGSRHKGSVDAYETAQGEIVTYGKNNDNKVSPSKSSSNSIPSKEEEDRERKALEEVAKKMMPVNMRDISVAKSLFECKVCDIRTNSEAQLEQHMKSSKHNRLLAAESIHPSKTGEKVQQFQCKTCNIQFTTKLQLDQHVASKEHQNNQGSKNSGNNTSLQTPSTPRYMEPSAAKPAEALSSLLESKDKPLALTSVTPKSIMENSRTNTTLSQSKQHNATSLSNNETSLNDEEQERKILEEVAIKSMRVNVSAGLSILECKVCDIWTNSRAQLEEHMGSLKHRRKLLGVEQEKPQKLPSKPKDKFQPFICKTCNIMLNSQNQLDHHNWSYKHKNKLLEPGSGLSVFECKDCDILTNSKVQFEQHMISPKHKNTTAAMSAESSKTEGKVQQYLCTTCDVQVSSQQQLDEHKASEKHKLNLYPPALPAAKPAPSAPRYKELSGYRYTAPSAPRYKELSGYRYTAPSAPRYKELSGYRYTAPSAPRYTPYPMRRP